MDTSKVSTLLIAILLIVCLALSLMALASLCHVIEENRALQEETKRLGRELDEWIDVWQDKSDSHEDSLPTVGDLPETETGYLIRTAGEQIGVYTKDGTPVRFLEIPIGLLPPADRQAIADGIEVPNWNQVLSFIEDYTT